MTFNLFFGTSAMNMNMNMNRLFAAFTASLALSCAFDAGSTLDESESAGSSAQALRSDNIRVLTLNVRINDKDDADSIYTRIPRIHKVIDRYDPDIIGFQEVEERSVDELMDGIGSYDGFFWNRGGLNNPEEGVVLLARKGRFVIESHDWRNFTSFSPNRPISRFKLRDTRTDRVLDVFVTHFPSNSEDAKERMAEKVTEWVEEYGDNVILMGDFNTGYNKEGEREGPYQRLLSTSRVPLYNAYVTANGPLHDEQGFITDKAFTPEKRQGRMIDHIMYGPGYGQTNAWIDRSLFDGGRLINCDDGNSNDTGATRTECYVPPPEWFIPVTSLKSYSDHWAVVADLHRVDCPNGC
jgi:endonuclease/exonuclease/phosphatase family metal-dependent hydrolase